MSNKTADQRHAELSTAIKEKLARINQLVEQRQQQRQPFSWVGVGDLAHVSDLLDELLDFIDA